MHSWLEQQQLLLSKQITQIKLPHAILINGVEGAGKSDLSLWLIQVLSCTKPQNSQGIILPCNVCKACLLHKSHTYPDHLLIESGGKSIGVDQVRQASRFFEKTAQIGHCKTTLITAAHHMTISAANALLKTLEEPNANNYIVLLTSEVETLLPTIISRCYVIDIRPPVGEKLLAELKQSGSDPFVNLSHLKELSDSFVNDQYQHFESCFFTFLQNKTIKRSEILSLLVDNTNSVRWLEKVMVKLMRQQYNWLKGDIILNEQVIWSIYQLVLSAIKQLKLLMQANKQFIFEKLLVDITAVIEEK
ncbi:MULTISPECIES: DNA polymerase III subunit delta' [unclassified Colwellia]|jgi:DNA polymerase-3 subunit delta'|uniref:DNA polymerase III subunit delta' n=1 Tax=unclassified Colwellia TaxID=196834 RepID=UPI0015F4E421|nr:MULTISPECIES: DNA polymerase III subunit delta' [unclassified Colwellia]MBA6350145.1 DNA polymerase III subunit delta' [Colwellia sp. BRX8-9]MBA6380258.1 DNA polymerase III subunit delta' [Colwellia sp. BRX10-7]MBA6387656.1 DNA polymerase III subunit delta' [Colwellia sp. BRX10-2]MBA6402680.1 DNA polymerase III subunit delta' [Colwellia sp. BRX10-5]MBA6405121.1 DNA polymerase III subunit delta' [Colwellia sp. BRX10-1]